MTVAGADLIFVLVSAALYSVQAILAIVLIMMQPIDVYSTIVALRRPDVREVGDTEIGLGNISGLAQQHLGPYLWWVIKMPFLVFLPLTWTPLPIQIALPVIALLVPVVAYFIKIVSTNFDNAYGERPIDGQSA